MIWRLVLCAAVIGLVLSGCGRKDKAVEDETDLGQFFGRDFRAPKDRSVRLQADMTTTSFAAGEPIEMTMLLNNASSGARTLPIGLQTDAGTALTFFSAIVADPDGEYQRIALSPDDAHGELISENVEGYGAANIPIDLAARYNFDKPGRYQVVVFYRVKEGKLPDGSNAGWTGTVWTSPITINVE